MSLKHTLREKLGRVTMRCHSHEMGGLLARVATRCHWCPVMADTIIFPTEGRRVVAEWWRGNARAGHHWFSFHLFKDYVAPFDKTLTVARFTRCDFPNYDARNFQFKTNGAPHVVGPDNDIGLHLGVPDPDWTIGWGSQTVKGFWVQDNHTGKILFAVLYETPVEMVGVTRHTIELEAIMCQCPTVPPD